MYFNVSQRFPQKSKSSQAVIIGYFVLGMITSGLSADTDPLTSPAIRSIHGAITTIDLLDKTIAVLSGSKELQFSITDATVFSGQSSFRYLNIGDVLNIRYEVTDNVSYAESVTCINCSGQIDDRTQPYNGKSVTGYGNCSGK